MGKKRKPGRPMKYQIFIQILDDDEVYAAATVVSNGEEAGLFVNNSFVSEKDRQDIGSTEAKLRIRHTLARFASSHGFPQFGDGLIFRRGQAPMRGWWGWRWKAALASRETQDSK